MVERPRFDVRRSLGMRIVRAAAAIAVDWASGGRGPAASRPLAPRPSKARDGNSERLEDRVPEGVSELPTASVQTG
jgi:hypothetical protein